MSKMLCLLGVHDWSDWETDYKNVSNRWCWNCDALQWKTKKKGAN